MVRSIAPRVVERHRDRCMRIAQLPQPYLLRYWSPIDDGFRVTAGGDVSSSSHRYERSCGANRAACPGRCVPVRVFGLRIGAFPSVDVSLRWCGDVSRASGARKSWLLAASCGFRCAVRVFRDPNRRHRQNLAGAGLTSRVGVVMPVARGWELRGPRCFRARLGFASLPWERRTSYPTPATVAGGSSRGVAAEGSPDAAVTRVAGRFRRCLDQRTRQQLAVDAVVATFLPVARRLGFLRDSSSRGGWADAVSPACRRCC